MRMHMAGWSSTGTVREKNDDHYCLGPFVEQEAFTALSLDDDARTVRDYGVLAAVADGIGGYAGGALASRVVLETLSALFYAERRTGCTGAEFAACLTRCLEQTQHTLEGVLRRTPEYADAGTTLAGVALMPPDVLVLFHIGDSRVLRAAAGYVRALTLDHNPLAPDVASGRLTEAEAAELPEASQLTRSLGLRGDTRIEINTEYSYAPQTRLLIGTDGWHGIGRGCTRQAIQEAVRRDDDVVTLTRALVEDTIAADGRDNATLVVMELTDGR